jgi:hypothetical protein
VLFELTATLSIDPILGHELWKRRIDEILKVLEGHRDLSVDRFLANNIWFIPHSNYVTFVTYLASRQDFSWTPLYGCHRFDKWMQLELLPLWKNSALVSQIFPVFQNYITEQANLLIKPTTETMCLEASYKYQEIMIEPRFWAESGSSTKYSDMLWEGLWARIRELRAQRPEQPLQILVLDASRTVEECERTRNILTRFEDMATLEKIFFRVLAVKRDGFPCSKQPEPSDGNLFVQGLPPRSVKHINELLLYLRNNQLLAHANEDGDREIFSEIK